MEQILFIVAAAMSKNDIIEELSKLCEAYKANPSKEIEEKIFLNSLLFTIKMKIEQNGGDAFKILAEYQKQKEAFDIGSRITGNDKKP